MKKIKFSVFTISTFLILGLSSTANAAGMPHSNYNKSYTQTTYINNQHRNVKVVYDNNRNDRKFDNNRNTKVIKKVIVVEQKPKFYPRNVYIERRPQVVRPIIQVKLNIPLFR